MYPVPDPLPVDLVREPRFGPLFLESVDLNHRFESMGTLLVSVFRSHDGQSRLSWDARSTLSSK
jgi:hypothetical protein